MSKRLSKLEKQENNVIGIYKIINPKGKVYIGQSWNILERKRIYNGKHCKLQQKLYNPILKYGWENHIFEIIHELPKDVTQEVLDRYEVLYWELHKDCNINMLNIKTPGIGGKHSKETIIKMKNNCFWNGKKGNQHVRYGSKRSQDSLSLFSRKVLDEKTKKVYRSITYAALKNNIPYPTLYAYLNGNRKNKTSMKFIDL